MSSPADRLQLDALSAECNLRRRLSDFAQSVAYLRDPEISATCRRLWEGSESAGGLVGQLWVEGIFPSTGSGQTARQLAAAGLLNAALIDHLDHMGVFSVDRDLYLHQVESIRLEIESRNSERPAVVVTAGTGAGKTEAFLLPILNLLFNHRGKRRTSGVQAIILYPMNALVNDQVDRLYQWLKGQTSISLFHFTSETPEDDRDAKTKGFPEFESCRRRTRKDARAHIPDVLITNYSMLEYMLCRPQDAVFFGQSLSMFVVDEAHIYSGLVENEEVAAQARSVLSPLVGESVLSDTMEETTPARLLHRVLRFSPVIARLEDSLWQARQQGILRLRELALRIWGSDEEHAIGATVRLLQLGSSARESATSLPLVPHKLHLVARAPVTVSVCMNPQCTATENRLRGGAGRIMTEAVERCPDCGRATLTLCRCAKRSVISICAEHKRVVSCLYEATDDRRCTCCRFGIAGRDPPHG